MILIIVWNNSKKKKPQEYLRLVKWGRKYPTRFVEKILEIDLTDH